MAQAQENISQSTNREESWQIRIGGVGGQGIVPTDPLEGICALGARTAHRVVNPIGIVVVAVGALVASGIL